MDKEFFVDEYCTLKNPVVYRSSANNIFSCTLNQTNIEKNSNKFYIMQILVVKNFNINMYFLYTRHGRIGEVGVSNTIMENSPYLLVKDFQKIFRNKTRNRWTGNIEDFIPKRGKYVMMDIIQPKIEEKDEKIISNINHKVLKFISLISDKKMMLNTVKKLDLDTKKLPLGKISFSQLEKAHSILKTIENLIKFDKSERENIINLSSSFWTLIPYSCGRNRPPIINTEEQIKRYGDLLEVLENIEVAVSTTYVGEEKYKSLGIDMEPIQKNSKEWNIISKFVKNTHAPTHDYKLDLLEIFKINKEEQDRLDFDNYFDNMKDHRLLVHGSRMANYTGILKNGIRIPKPTQVSNGSILGLGAYFSDSISKSYNYCYSGQTNNIGFVIICEVALGDNPHFVKSSNIKKPSVGYTSRIALGKNIPDELEEEIVKTKSSNNVRFPCGKLKESKMSGGSFIYNEYVVYDSRQYRFRYLLKLKSDR